MNTKKLIEEHRGEILAEMENAERESLLCPDMEFRVFIDNVGYVGTEEWIANDNAYLKFSDGYERYYIHTFNSEGFDILWDWWYQDFNCFLEDIEELPEEYHPLAKEMWLSGRDSISQICFAHGLPDTPVCELLDESVAYAVGDFIGEEDVEMILDDYITTAIEMA